MADIALSARLFPSYSKILTRYFYNFPSLRLRLTNNGSYLGQQHWAEV